MRIVLSGAGAAGTAVLKLLLAAGARDVVVADIDGRRARRPARACAPSLRWTAEHTNPRGVTGHAARRRSPAPTCSSACRAPDVLTGDDIATMAPGLDRVRAGEPAPRGRPGRRRAARRGRRHRPQSDFANQINNVLAFPGVFRGLLDAQSHRVTDDHAARRRARALASVVTDDELNPTYIVPSVFNPEVTTVVAAAVEQRRARAHGTRPADATPSVGPTGRGTGARAAAGQRQAPRTYCGCQ